MKKALSRITKGGLALACAAFIACGGHETTDPDPSTGAGGGAGSSPFDASRGLDGSTAFDGSLGDRAFFDGGNQPVTDTF